MLGHHFGTILARTDPFDVAQGVERHIRKLTGTQVRETILSSRERMNEWYRAEFLPLVEERDDERVKRGFAQTLKSNLRAIPLFGPAFCEGVIGQLPGDRTVAMGEETRPWRRLRPFAFGAIALVLLFCGAAAEHVISTARATAQTPVVTVTPSPEPMQTPVPVAIQPRAETSRPSSPPPSPRPSPRAAVAQGAAPTAQGRAMPPASPPQATPGVAAVQQSAPVLSRAAAQSTPPPGSGVKTIVAEPPPVTPAPSPSPVDVTDMPQSYTDATPLPKDETAPPAQVPVRQRVATPTPGPNRSWVHSTVKGTLKAISHLNPFKRHDAPTPTATPSPSGRMPK